MTIYRDKKRCLWRTSLGSPSFCVKLLGSPDELALFLLVQLIPLASSLLGNLRGWHALVLPELLQKVEDEAVDGYPRAARLSALCLCPCLCLWLLALCPGFWLWPRPLLLGRTPTRHFFFQNIVVKFSLTQLISCCLSLPIWHWRRFTFNLVGLSMGQGIFQSPLYFIFC